MCILLPQLIGTTMVTDDSTGVDGDGLPVTTTTFADLEAPGTKFGTLTNSDWETAILNRFPQAEFQHFSSMSNLYTGLDAGLVTADSIVISEERLESIGITNALMKDEYYLLVRRNAAMKEVPKAPLFVQNLKDSIRRNFVTEDRYKILLPGLGVTLALSLAAGIFGTLLGAFICFLHMRKTPFVKAFASLYIRIFRSLPVVVLLLVLNYIVFRKSGLGGFKICAITFSIEFSAYCAEIFRSGINAVPDGQFKAAAALGFGKLQAFQKVIWPQAMLHILPVYSGQFISTVKMTAVAGYISVVDLTKASDIIRARTYEAFFPLFFTAAVYYLICYILVTVLRFLEKKIDPTVRSLPKDILEIIRSFDPERAENFTIGSKSNTVPAGTCYAPGRASGERFRNFNTDQRCEF